MTDSEFNVINFDVVSCRNDQCRNLFVEVINISEKELSTVTSVTSSNKSNKLRIYSQKYVEVSAATI